MASSISVALPAVEPKGWLISVMVADVGTPAWLATVTILSASKRASSGVDIKAPLPAFTSMANEPKPADNFFDKIEAVRSEERRVGKECRSRWSTDHWE